MVPDSYLPGFDRDVFMTPISCPITRVTIVPSSVVCVSVRPARGLHPTPLSRKAEARNMRQAEDSDRFRILMIRPPK
jgi:hypothetical protein